MRQASELRQHSSVPLEEVNLLELAPVRTAEWKEVGDRVVVERPRPTGSGIRGLWKRASYHLAAPRIRLDACGTFAWKRFDGRLTVREVAGELRERFGESAEPAEERLGEFVRLLWHGGLLSYPGW